MKENKNITPEKVTEDVVDETINDVVENELNEAEETFEELIKEAEDMETDEVCNPVKEGIVTATKLNVRALPYASASVVGVLDKETKVTIEGEENEFYKISANGLVGYCVKQYINSTN